MRVILMLALAAKAFAFENQEVTAMLSRLSEEAAVFVQLAPQTLSEETFEQRAIRGPSRFRLRVGAAATAAPKLHTVTRQIVSEYSFTSLRAAPENLHELRRVVTVDGKQVETRQEARHALFLGARSDDDRVKKRMLENFSNYGLAGPAATDFGQILLLFTRRRLADYAFEISGQTRIGPDEAVILNYRQVAGSQNVTIFAGRRQLRQPLQGQIFLRKPDYLPLRITMRSERTQQKTVFRDEASVDYALSPHGVVLPAAVVHREFANDLQLAENTYRYAAFKKFGADAEIRFDVVPDPPKP